MERKFLITSVFVTLGGVAFLSGYLLMPEQNLDQQSGTFIERFNSNTEIDRSNNKSSKVVPLSSRKFVSFVSPSSKKIVAVDKNGNVVELDTDNFIERTVSTLKHSNLSDVWLSPSGNSLVYSFYNTQNVKKYSYFDIKKGETVEMADGFKSAAFSPHDDQLVYLITNGGEGELLISKGAEVIKRVLKTRIDDGVVSWPDAISIVSRGKDGYGDLFVLKDGNTLNKVFSYKYNLGVNWSPTGGKLIFSAKDSTGSDRLFYKDVGNNSIDLDLNAATSALKCAWLDESNVICGITNRAYLKDEFYKINLADGSKTMVSAPSINILTKEISVNRLADYILVLNSIDSGLYALKTKEPR